MADKAEVKFVILWEEELRKAALLLKRCVDAQGTDEFSQLALDALNASVIALRGVEIPENHICLVSGTKDIVSRVEAKPRKKRPRD